MLFLFDYALDLCVPVENLELVDGGLCVDGQRVVHIQKLLGGILILLGQVDVQQTVHNLQFVVDASQRNEGSVLPNVLRVGDITPAPYLIVVLD